jgi:hypothetical protein
MLHGNPLSGSIPSELAKLSKLTSLTLHGNPMLNGSLPAGLYDLLRLDTSLNLTADCAAGAAALATPPPPTPPARRRAALRRRRRRCRKGARWQG